MVVSDYETASGDLEWNCLSSLSQNESGKEQMGRLKLYRVTLHQVVGVDSCVSFQAGNSFNIYSVCLVMHKSSDNSSVLRVSVIGEDT